MEETLNEEEIAADAAITDTFQKIAYRWPLLGFLDLFA
jgi:hypothetical protein